MARYRRPLAAVASLLAGGLLMVASSSASPPESAMAGWPRQLGSSEFDGVYDLALSSSGDVFVSGATWGTLPGQTSAGGGDAFVARYDKYGKLVWMRQFGTNDRDEAMSIAVSGSSIYIGGQTEGTFPGQVLAGGTDSFVARYDTNGNQKWVRQFGTAGEDWAQGISYSNSDAYVVGHTDGAFPGEVNVGSTDAFVARYSSSGVKELIYQMGTGDEDRAFGVAVSGSDTWITGYTAGAFPGEANAGDQDIFLGRFDKSGVQKALDQFGTAGTDLGYDVTVSGSQIYITGGTAGLLPGAPSAGGNSDAFVARFDKSAVRQWVTQLGDNDSEEAFGIAVRSGKVYITGITNGALPNWQSSVGLDGFVAKFGTNGIEEWSRQFGTVGTDYSGAIAVRSSDTYGGAVVVGGNVEGTVFGQIDFGNDDGFIATFLK